MRKARVLSAALKKKAVALFMSRALFLKKAGLGVRRSAFQRKTMSPQFISHLMRLKKFANTKASACHGTPSGSMPRMLNKDRQPLTVLFQANVTVIQMVTPRAKVIA